MLGELYLRQIVCQFISLCVSCPVLVLLRKG